MPRSSFAARSTSSVCISSPSRSASRRSPRRSAKCCGRGGVDAGGRAQRALHGLFRRSRALLIHCHISPGGSSRMSLRAAVFTALSTAVAIAVPVAGSMAQALADPEATAQGDVSVTIYNNGLALVQDVRQLNISSGRSTIAFPDVSAQIRPETLSFAAEGTGIVEQNFDFDLLTPAKLMEKAIGQTVTLVRTNPATGQETRERATVLSTVGGVVIQIGDRIEVLRDDGLPVRVIFDRVPPNLRARPTLSVTVD